MNQTFYYLPKRQMLCICLGDAIYLSYLFISIYIFEFIRRKGLNKLEREDKKPNLITMIFL